MSARTEALQARLRAIPEGEIAQTARTAGVTYRQLSRLRAGAGLTGVRLSTLEKLAEALGEPISALLGEGDAPSPAERARAQGVDPKRLARLATRLERFAEQALRTAEDVAKLAAK